MQTPRRDPPVALVTGGNRGIGHEVCRALAARGHHVVLTSRDRARAEAAAEDLRRGGALVTAHPLDVTADGSVATLRKAVVERFGGVDVLVNDAGVLPHGREGAWERSVLDEDVQALRDAFEANALGALRMAQAFVPLMVEQRWGRVVNVSSGAGQLDDMQDGAPAYRVSKTALHAITRMLASATAGSGVLVNAACPGWVRTDMGGPQAPRSLGEGADTIVWLATLPDDGPSGQFFRDRQPIPW